MTVSLASPEDNDPLSYDRLDSEWRQWYEIAHRFSPKVLPEDRDDIEQDIIIKLNKPLLLLQQSIGLPPT